MCRLTWPPAPARDHAVAVFQLRGNRASPSHGPSGPRYCHGRTENETAAEVKGVFMSEHDKSDEARKGLIDSVKGRAKEVAGAVLGNDSLTAEGQLEQTQARERKEANTIQAV